MKPPPFTYHDPRTVPEALDLLADKENAKLLAGGQSLMPMLNFRYVQPDHIIDINYLDDLSYINSEDGSIRIGAMTRQRDIEYSEVIAVRCPLMIEAVNQVGHRQTRNRGTLGGSLSHLDPASELPAVALACDATVHVESKRGKRDIPMAEFPAMYMTPSMELDEMLMGVTFPVWAEGHGYAFVEFARRHGDFAIASAAILLDVGSGGAIDRATVTIGGVGQVPVRWAKAEEILTGQAGSEELFREAGEACREIEALEDVHASKTYRQHLAAVLTRRALVKAYARAANGKEVTANAG